MSSPRGTTARLPYYIVNAFTDSAWRQPGGVMLLDEWLADAQLGTGGAAQFIGDGVSRSAVRGRI